MNKQLHESGRRLTLQTPSAVNPKEPSPSSWGRWIPLADSRRSCSKCGKMPTMCQAHGHGDEQGRPYPLTETDTSKPRRRRSLRSWGAELSLRRLRALVPCRPRQTLEARMGRRHRVPPRREQQRHLCVAMTQAEVIRTRLP